METMQPLNQCEGLVHCPPTSIRSICNDDEPRSRLVLLYARMGLHCYNLLQGKNLQLSSERVYSRITDLEAQTSTYRITLKAMDPATDLPLTFKTRVSEQVNGKFVLNCNIAGPLDLTKREAKIDYSYPYLKIDLTRPLPRFIELPMISDVVGDETMISDVVGGETKISDVVGGETKISDDAALSPRIARREPELTMITDIVGGETKISDVVGGETKISDDAALTRCIPRREPRNLRITKRRYHVKVDRKRRRPKYEIMPEWPPENPFENSKRCYVLNESELQDNDWIRLYLELAVATTNRTSEKNHDLSNLKIVKVAIDTATRTTKDVMDDDEEGLKAKNAIVYIRYTDSCEARVGMDVDRVSIVRRAFDERTGGFDLIGQNMISPVGMDVDLGRGCLSSALDQIHLTM